MTSSMLAAVRDAVAGAVDDSHGDPAAGRFPSQTGSESMSETDGKPVAETKTGISRAAHDAAVTQARTDGHAAGTAEANERLGTVLGAEGIKGDGKRMAAGLDLALKSPAMAAGDVVAFVAGNVAATETDPAAAYERDRLAATNGGLDASGLAQPGGKPAAKGDRSVLEAVVARTNKRR